MLLGYNTNGFAFHRFDDTCKILAEIGYQAVGITVDHYTLSPFSPTLSEDCRAADALLRSLGFRSVIETGARFLLDPRRKHQPTLLSDLEAERKHRLRFLESALDIGAELNSDGLSFWSGKSPPNCSAELAWDRLVAGVEALLALAEKKGMDLVFEPEPGMFVETTAQGLELIHRLGGPQRLKLTIDIGHVHCLSEGPIPDILRQVGARIGNIHIEDMKQGVHDHLMFGAGEIDFPPIFEALSAIGYSQGVYVELSRHAHDAVNAAQEAFAFLASAGSPSVRRSNVTN